MIQCQVPHRNQKRCAEAEAEAEAESLQNTWAAAQRGHLGRAQTVQGMLHAHLLVAPQPHRAGDGAAQLSAISWVAQQRLRSRAS